MDQRQSHHPALVQLRVIGLRQPAGQYGHAQAVFGDAFAALFGYTAFQPTLAIELLKLVEFEISTYYGRDIDAIQ